MVIGKDAMREMQVVILGVFLLLVNTKAHAESDWKAEWDKMYKDGGALGRITVRVVDDKGAPVDGATVTAGFFSTPRPTAREGVTIVDGTVVLEGRSVSDVRFTVQKAGYYKTSKPYDFIKNAPSKQQAVMSSKWIPWNPTVTLTLKKIRNPVPMHAKRVSGISLPCDKSAGFDLEVEDWVTPLGKGRYPDLLLRVETSERYGRKEYEARMSFSNEADGVQLLETDSWSEYPWAYEAPVTGYRKDYELPKDKADSLEDKRQYYVVFRVRTHLGPNGQVESAKYGKMNTGNMHGSSPEDRGCAVTFSYWFNPDGTRNLESDPKRNLSVATGRDSRISVP